MFKHLLISFFISFFLLQSNLNAQDETSKKVYYSEIVKDIKEFLNIQRDYMNRRNMNSITTSNSVYKVISDTINKTIESTYLDNYKFKVIDGRKISISSIKEPIFLMVTDLTGKSCSICKSQIPFLNNLIEKYKDKAKFILLNYGRTKGIKKGMINNNAYIIPKTGHKFYTMFFSDFEFHLAPPRVFLIDKNKRIEKTSNLLDFKIIKKDTIKMQLDETIEYNIKKIERKLKEMVEE